MYRTSPVIILKKTLPPLRVGVLFALVVGGLFPDNEPAFYTLSLTYALWGCGHEMGLWSCCIVGVCVAGVRVCSRCGGRAPFVMEEVGG